MKFTQSTNELVVIAKGIVLSGRDLAGGDAIAKETVPGAVRIELPIGTILNVTAVTRTLPRTATFTVPLLRDGRPVTMTAKLPVKAINAFAVPVLVPRRAVMAS